MTAPTLRKATRVWARIGCLSFGGPAAQIALMHREIVETRSWLSERQFMNALSFCMLLPGPEAMQLATYAGWRMHGVRGGLVAGGLFVLPGALVMAALALAYLSVGDLPVVRALFLGVKAAVLVIVLEALLRIARRALQGSMHRAIAAASFVALFALSLPYPLVIAAASLLGWVTSGGVAADPAPDAAPVPWRATLRTVGLWLAIWWGPLLALEALMPSHVLGQIGRFFSVLATVTFGGAYAVLAYMADAAVTQFGWLSAPEMADALGLAETTPGPLILVTEFVGTLAAARQGGGWAVGLAGAAVTLWATFVPCFLWVFAGAPYIDRLGVMPRLRGALAAITAAVVGVIANLSLWFALQVTFASVSRQGFGPVQPWVPDLATIDWRVPLLTAAAGMLMLGLRQGVLTTLAVTSALGLGFATLWP